MKRGSVRLYPYLLAAPLVAVACGGLPPDAPLPQTITTIRLGHVLCPGTEPLPGVVLLNFDCQLEAEVFDEWGIPIHEPRLVWRSSNTFILTASGGGKVGSIRGVNLGTATVTVSGRLGHAQTETRIHVIPPR
ncbi:MAG TPA: hypothetical protein VM778_09560 [Gemmatimonadota bacterium]|nr:hypothetical protein [Gemmatimonadota bacterium]